MAIDYDLDYRSKNDGAWYTCGVLLQHPDHLRVKFKDFANTDSDELYSIADLSSHHQIEHFLNRFRPVSVPVEENECSKVIQGMQVCAIHRGVDEVLYFDAIVDAVHHREHTAEKCLCTYLLFWQHGPREGSMTEATLEDIYLIVHGAIHPKVAEFINLVKQKLTGTSFQSQVFGSVGHNSHFGSSAEWERSFPELGDHDVDLGGAKKTNCHHYIVLENLDKDLCPLLMMEFIREHTSIVAQTCVFPTLLGETNARGAIMVDTSTKVKRIFEFINNPNHFITSLYGRPWVITEDNLKTGTFNKNLQSLQPKYESQNYSTKNGLKIVRLGTEEYRKSKQLKDLYLEFRNHLKGLVQRLAMEEEKKTGTRSVFANCKHE